MPIFLDCKKCNCPFKSHPLLSMFSYSGLCHNLNIPFSFSHSYVRSPHTRFSHWRCTPDPLGESNDLKKNLFVPASFQRPGARLFLILVRLLGRAFHRLGCSYWSVSIIKPLLLVRPNKCVFCAMGSEFFGLLCTPGWLFTTPCCTFGLGLFTFTLTHIRRMCVYVFLLFTLLTLSL
jgi:hypothetical protein